MARVRDTPSVHFWVLKATDMKEALDRGRKAVVACRAPVEVRQFHSL